MYIEVRRTGYHKKEILPNHKRELRCKFNCVFLGEGDGVEFPFD